MLTYARPIFNLKNKFKNGIWHLTVWFLFMLYESFAVAMATGSAGKIIFYLLHYPINILLFYFHAIVILPLAMAGKKHIIWKLPILTLLEIFLLLILKYHTDCLITDLFPGMESRPILDDRFIYGGIWRSVYFIMLASGYYYLVYYIKERDSREFLERRAYEEDLKSKEVLIELNKTRNAFLRAQINPHFFFNTLNFIYSKIHKTDPAAGKTLSILSKLMRYALQSENNPNLINLSEELEQALLLLDLWKIRQEDENPVFLVKIQNGVQNALFIPLVVLTLLENIFKHGNISLPNQPGILKIYKEGGCLVILTQNLINTGINDSGDHTGLKNIRQRLLLTYGNDAQIKHHIEGGYFMLEIRAPFLNSAEVCPEEKTNADFIQIYGD